MLNVKEYMQSNPQAGEIAEVMEWCLKQVSENSGVMLMSVPSPDSILFRVQLRLSRGQDIPAGMFEADTSHSPAAHDAGSNAAPFVSKESLKRLKDFIVLCSEAGAENPVGMVYQYESMTDLPDPVAVWDVMRRWLDTQKRKQTLDQNSLGQVAAQMQIQGRTLNTVRMGLLLMAGGYAPVWLADMHVCTLEHLSYVPELYPWTCEAILKLPWETMQTLLFKLARELPPGERRTCFVVRLYPGDPEVQEWLLCHGCDPDGGDGMLAYTCMRSGKLIGRLKSGTLTEEELTGADRIMHGLALGTMHENSPVDSMLDAFSEADELIWRYVMAIREQPMAPYRKETLEGLLAHFSSKRHNESMKWTMKARDAVISLLES